MRRQSNKAESTRGFKNSISPALPILPIGVIFTVANGLAYLLLDSYSTNAFWVATVILIAALSTVAIMLARNTDTKNTNPNQEAAQRLPDTEPETESYHNLELELERVHSTLAQSQNMALLGQLSSELTHEIHNPVVFVSNNISTLREYIFFLDRLTKQLLDLMTNLSKTEKLQHEEQFHEIERTLKIEDLDFVLNDADCLLAESIDSIDHIKRLIGSLNVFLHSGTDKRPINANELLEQTLNLTWGRLKYAQVETKFGKLPSIPIAAGPFSQMLVQIIMHVINKSDQKTERICISSRVQKEEVLISIGTEPIINLETDSTTKSTQAKPPPDYTLLHSVYGMDEQAVSFCMKVASLHSGRIELDNQNNQSTFVIVLPFSSSAVPQTKTETDKETYSEDSSKSSTEDPMKSSPKHQAKQV